MNRLIRIGVFYDGQYFFNVSNYYCYEHPRKSRIAIKGLHEFIRNNVSMQYNVDLRLCQIVDAHYFRGRLSAQEAESSQKLYTERLFDDILMSENIVTHYMPLKPGVAGGHVEKGVDVWLALEAYEQAIYKRYDVLVLLAGDGDYVPLLRKLNALGIRVMLLSWDFEYTDEYGKKKETRTSQQLYEEAAIPINMSTLIDDRVHENEMIIRNLFINAASRGNRFAGALRGDGKAAQEAAHGGAAEGERRETPEELCPALRDSEEAGPGTPDARGLLPEAGASAYTQLALPLPSGARDAKRISTPADDDVYYTSTIISLRQGFGFIGDKTRNNIFFHYNCLENIDFYGLAVGMRVRYTILQTLEGRFQAKSVWVLEEEEYYGDV